MAFFTFVYCLEFFTPTNDGLDSPKEISLKNSPRGPIGRVLSLPCIIGFKICSPRRSIKKSFYCVGGVVVMVVVVGFGVGRITFWHFGPSLFDFVQFFSVVTSLAEKGDDFKIG